MKTHNKKGELTAYGLACGYFQKQMIEGIEVTLTRQHGLYFVSLWNPVTHTSVDEGNYPFELLTEAKRFINLMKQKAKQ